MSFFDTSSAADSELQAQQVKTHRELTNVLQQGLQQIMTIYRETQRWVFDNPYGLEARQVLAALDDTELKELQDFTQALRQLGLKIKPDQTPEIRVLTDQSNGDPAGDPKDKSNKPDNQADRRLDQLFL